MTEHAKLEKRVTTLEREMPEVRKLANDASKEVGDVHARLRAHTKVLEALRETQLEMHKAQVEQGKEIRDLRTEMREGFAQTRAGFVRLEGEMRQGFSTMGVGMAQITALLKIAIDDSEKPDES